MGTIARVIYFDIGQTLVDTSVSPWAWMPDAKELIETLAASTTRIGVLSNTGSLARPSLTTLLPTDFEFDDFEPSLVLLSSETSVEKPSIDAFKLAVAKASASDASLDPGEILFCGENAIEVLAAQDEGLKGLRVTPATGDSALASLSTILSEFSTI